ncbi:MAG: hypothetical protein HY815_19975 [Candidatus Riflebacteria bacterium]|nr:hypothetical protein [Candidatus Riflebacteria bacterium]
MVVFNKEFGPGLRDILWGPAERSVGAPVAVAVPTANDAVPDPVAKPTVDDEARVG